MGKIGSFWWPGPCGLVIGPVWQSRDGTWWGILGIYQIYRGDIWEILAACGGLALVAW